MKQISKVLTSLIVSAFCANSAHGAEITEFYTGVRQLGMGGAYSAVANDETSILTNPAGLGKLRDTTVTIADPEFSGAWDNTRIVKLDNLSKVLNIQGLMEALNEAKGTHWHAKAQFFPSVVTGNFGAGIHAKYSYDAEVDEAGNTFRLDYTNDYAAALGHSVRFFGGVLKVGATLRVVNRTEIHKDIATSSTDLTVESLASEGLGAGADLGMIITLPVAYLPALSVVARDVGNTRYNLADGMTYSSATRPQETPQTLDVGFALFPLLSNHTRFTFTAEMHDVMKAYVSEEDSMKRIHAGLEINFHDFFFLRAGMNQRYWTSGIELASERFQLQAATYGEDIGTSTVPREDRRWVTKFALRF